MDKKTIVIFGSSRSDGNTMKAVKAVLGQRDIEIIDLSKYNISNYDYKNRNQHDDFQSIAEKMVTADNIIFATPVYWYSASAIFKTFFDRLTDLITIRKELGRSLKGKVCYAISSGTDKDLPIGFEDVFAQTANYFNMVYKNCFYYCVQKDGTMPNKIKESAKNWGNEIFK